MYVYLWGLMQDSKHAYNLTFQGQAALSVFYNDDLSVPCH